MPVTTGFKNITVTDLEIALILQCVQMGIKEITEQKVKLADMATNYDSSAGVFEYYAKRHKALEDIRKKLFSKDS